MVFEVPLPDLLCPLWGLGILDPWESSYKDHFVWSTGLAGKPDTPENSDGT